MKTKFLAVQYFLTGILFIVLEHCKTGFLPEITAKALIIPLLLLIFVVNTRNDPVGTHRLMFAALLFSWAGDVMLELTGLNEFLFVVGLLCFMLTQVLYLTVFRLTPGKGNARNKIIFFILPVYLYGAGLLYLMHDDLGDLGIPVVVYTIVILTMLAAAIARIEKVSRASYYFVLCGALLFVISDSMIAVNKFSYPFRGASALIMATYITGQFLIVTGYLKQHNRLII